MLTDSLTADLQRILNLSQLSIHLREEWSSTQNAGRVQIRQYIFDTIEANNCFLDTDKVPSLTLGSLSISHDKMLGGFVHTTDDCSLGFDIEINERLNEKNVRRFASEEEFLNAPSASTLWTAKEAAYKALPFTQQPTVIGEIELTNWKNIDKNWSLCQIGSVQKRPVHGYTVAVYKGEKQTLAVVKGPPQQGTGK